MKQSVFKTEAGRDKVRAYYNNVLSRFPFGQQYVDTSCGKTFLLTAGSPENEPVILLHGSVSNSAFWFPEMMALSGQYRVYAADIPGEAGNSCEYRPDLMTDDFALWLKDVLDALGISRATIIGNSLGGWMALKFATAFPERAKRLALIAASGIAPIRLSFLQGVTHGKQAGDPVKVTTEILGGQGIPKEVLDFMNLMAESYNPIEELPLFTDEQLRRLVMPVLFIGGEEDAIIDAQSSIERLMRLVPYAQTHLLPGCGHAVFNAMDYLAPFLGETAEQEAKRL